MADVSSTPQSDLGPRVVAGAIGVALVVLALWLWTERLRLPTVRTGAAVAAALAAGAAGQACFGYCVGGGEIARSLRWAAAVLASVAGAAAGALWLAAR